jgi:hypothetical protein
LCVDLDDIDNRILANERDPVEGLCVAGSHGVAIPGGGLAFPKARKVFEAQLAGRQTEEAEPPEWGQALDEERADTQEKPRRTAEWQTHLEKPLIRPAGVIGAVCCRFHPHFWWKDLLPVTHLGLACLGSDTRPPDGLGKGGVSCH